MERKKRARAEQRAVNCQDDKAPLLAAGPRSGDIVSHRWRSTVVRCWCGSATRVA